MRNVGQLRRDSRGDGWEREGVKAVGDDEEGASLPSRKMKGE